MATAVDPNFQRTDTPVFDSVRLTASSNQIQGTGGTVYTLPTASGTFRTTGSSQPVNLPTFSATVSVDPTAADVFRLNGVNGTSATATLNLAASPAAGQRLTFILKADGTGTVTYTFGTHFKVTGTVAVTLNGTVVVDFISDGTDALQVARTVSTAIAVL